VAIRYTPGQLRDAVGITKETFRYWKKDLPSLDVGSGHSPCFGPGDVLATAIVKTIIDSAGVSVSRIASLAPALFHLCGGSAWPQLERQVVMLCPSTSRVELLPLGSAPPEGTLALLVPLRPVIDQLRARLLEADVQTQTNLSFPPVQVGASR
jgi:hypothetical protein